MHYCIEINNSAEYDVIVVGSGPSGIGVAVSAGRNGAKTLIINGTHRF